MGTHSLETGTCQDTERNRASEGYSQAEDKQREGLVRTGNETDQARDTHVLEMAEGGTCHGTETN